MKYLALSVGGYDINAPAGVPAGGLDTTGSSAIQAGINLIFIIGVVLAIIFVIYAGIQWTMSGGDKQKIQQARARLIYSLVGLVVIAASFFIINTVISLLGGNPKFFLNTP